MNVTIVSPQLIALLSALLSLAGCAILPGGLPVRSSLAGEIIETRVDSEVARYYLASYLAGKRRDAALDERIDRVYQSAPDGLPDRHELKRLSDEFSIDFAALHLSDRIARLPANRRFRELFAQARSYIRKAFPEGRVSLPAAAAGYEVLFVPGYLYKRHPFTGADFAAPREALQRVGLARDFVETDEDGAIEANADLVVAALRARARTGRRLIVVSASKSGPEVALALTALGSAEARHVAAWINIVGTLQGTPLADNGLWYQLEDLIGRVDVAGVESLTTKRSRERFGTFRIPEHVLVVNYMGIPLTGNISSLARTGFLELRNHGPNDGLSLLPDLIFPGGLTLAELGRDHFLLDEQIDVTTVALAVTVIRWLGNHENKTSQVPRGQHPSNRSVH
ncbi:MAG: hypothetical protein ACREQ7_16305 [Candidatus Binatia bacterium]